MITIQKTLSVVTTGAYKLYQIWRWRLTHRHRKLLDLVHENSKILAGEDLVFAPERWGPADDTELSYSESFVMPKCYSYALDIDSAIEPGYLNSDREIILGISKNSNRKKELVDNLVLDGLRPVSCEDVKNSLLWVFNRAILCYYSTEASDYHFVRMDNGGTFSHKEGLYRPRELQIRSGTDLQTVSNRDGVKYRFIGVFSVNSNQQLFTKYKHNLKLSLKVIHHP